MRNKKPYHKKGNSNYRNNTSNVFLPPASLLHEYEEILPGSLDKIFELVAIEQNNRRKAKIKKQKFLFVSYRIGQIFGFIAFLALLYMAYYCRYVHDDEYFAMCVLYGGLAFFIFIHALSYKPRFPKSKRKHKKKHYNNRRHKR